MNRSSYIATVAIALLAFAFGTNTSLAQVRPSKASVELILVEASNNNSGVDSSLTAYANTLKRLFRFNSYRQISRTTTQLDLPGSTVAKLGQGNTLKITARASGREIAANLEWSAGIHARLKLKPRTPAVLGGPKIKNESGTYLLIVKLR
jgi:hypothetical protein